MSLLQHLHNLGLEPSIKLLRPTGLTGSMTVLSIVFRLEGWPGGPVYELATTGMASGLDVRDDLAGYRMDVWPFGRDGFSPAEDGCLAVSGSGAAHMVSAADLETFGESFGGGNMEGSSTSSFFSILGQCGDMEVSTNH